MQSEKPVARAMHERLTDDFAPIRLEIVDDSHRHAGHAGHSGAGESHFTVTIVAAAFAGTGRVARHRMIYASLQSWMNQPVHALVIKAFAPDEANT